ncbi:MAG: DUF1338 domain-containing protein [Gammaproteobacteria bacterium]|nr:MAG: DUF1338 domain-containing protein [Gammaproteobacteria bacterium]
MSHFVSHESIRNRFSTIMSEMYRDEVPLYGELLALVHDVNDKALVNSPALKNQLEHTGELSRLNMERHGAIRLGKPEELFTMRRLFAVMGMFPVGYYDLAPAGVPVHSTAFRALDDTALNQSPFRVFTSLLRLDLIADETLRQQASDILDKRQIFTDAALALIEKAEKQGGLDAEDAETFVHEALETFRWHKTSTVSHEMYQALLNQHRLVADVVAFRGPHINHLTPRTLDIDEIQMGMSQRNITPKAVIEGPPRRNCPILLRQTSFKALNEAVVFTGDGGKAQSGHHTARFGEIEQRGVAVTEKGQALYDKLLGETRAAIGGAPSEENAEEYNRILAQTFKGYPDTYEALYAEKLAYFHHFATDKKLPDDRTVTAEDMPDLIADGYVCIEPMVYEDFLPVSAAGIFQSNLGDDEEKSYDSTSNQTLFERDLGTTVNDLMGWYETKQAESISHCLRRLNER